MKSHWMKKQTLGYAVIATLLALVSLPNLPNQADYHRHKFSLPNRHRAVPTVAQAQSIPSGQRPPQTPSPTTPQAGSGQEAAPSAPSPSAPGTTPGTQVPSNNQTPAGTPTNIAPLYRVGRLKVRVLDGRTLRPLQGAEVVLIETEKRLTTDADGQTGWFQAPIIRNPRYRPMVAELHGQLGVLVYRNGYRDTVHLGIRMHEDLDATTTVWMYKIGPGDARIEPVLYEEPYHHLWLIELADRFRSKSQPGAGPQRP